MNSQTSTTDASVTNVRIGRLKRRVHRPANHVHRTNGLLRLTAPLLRHLNGLQGVHVTGLTRICTNVHRCSVNNNGALDRTNRVPRLGHTIFSASTIRVRNLYHLNGLQRYIIQRIFRGIRRISHNLRIEAMVKRRYNRFPCQLLNLHVHDISVLKRYFGTNLHFINITNLGL